MRTVVYYNSIIPPPDFLKSAAMIWDTIGMLDYDISRLDMGAHYPEEIVKLLTSSNIDLIKAIEIKPVNETIDADLIGAYLAVTQDILDNIVSVRPKEDKNESDLEPILDTWLQLGCLSEILNGNSSLDIITSEKTPVSILLRKLSSPPLALNTVSNQMIVFPSMEALLPVDINKVNIGQILEFRHENNLRRLQFLDQSTSVTKMFEGISTEKEFQKATRTYKDAALQELDQIRTIYKKARIDAVTQSLTALTATVGSTTFLDSFLHLAVINPTYVVAVLSLSAITILRAYEDKTASSRTSPWLYFQNAQKALSQKK